MKFVLLDCFMVHVLDCDCDCDCSVFFFSWKYCKVFSFEFEFITKMMSVSDHVLLPQAA